MHGPLINKKISFVHRSHQYDEEKNVGFDYKDVRKAAKFYLRYKNNPSKFLHEEAKHYKAFVDGMARGSWKTFFEYCFQDVLK